MPVFGEPVQRLGSDDVSVGTHNLLQCFSIWTGNDLTHLAMSQSFLTLLGKYLFDAHGKSEKNPESNHELVRNSNSSFNGDGRDF